MKKMSYEKLIDDIRKSISDIIKSFSDIRNVKSFSNMRNSCIFYIIKSTFWYQKLNSDIMISKNDFLISEMKMIFWYRKIGIKVPYGVPYRTDLTKWVAPTACSIME